MLDVADGGYLSWSYGCDDRFLSVWAPEFFSHYLICMDGIGDDSSGLSRTIFAPSYKSGRIEKRIADEAKLEKFLKVKAFHKSLLTTPMLNCWSYPGLEADDLIALLAWKYGPIKLLGIDKDLLQLGMYVGLMEKINGETVSLATWSKKLPKATLDTPLTPQKIPYLLATLGDKSDSIERLVPPYKLKDFKLLYEHKYYWWRTYEEYGERFLINLYLVTLPYPGLFGMSPASMLDCMANNCWFPDNYLWNRLNLFNPDLSSQLEAQR